MTKFKKGDCVIVRNNEKKTNEIGTVLSTYIRKQQRFYDIQTERGNVFQSITENPNVSTWYYITGQYNPQPKPSEI